MREGVPFLLGDWWEKGSGSPQSQDNVAGGDLWTRAWAQPWGAESEYPTEMIALSWVAGECRQVESIGMAT